MGICLLLWAVRDLRIVQPVAWLIVAAFAAYSVAGTRDYLVYMDTVWRLGRDANAAGIANVNLDAGSGWDGYHLYTYGLDNGITKGRTKNGPWWVYFYAQGHRLHLRRHLPTRRRFAGDPDARRLNLVGGQAAQTLPGPGGPGANRAPAALPWLGRSVGTQPSPSTATQRVPGPSEGEEEPRSPAVWPRTNQAACCVTHVCSRPGNCVAWRPFSDPTGGAMPRATRQRREPTDDWQQLCLLARFPEQLTDELIRPVVLFGSSPAERARQTGAPQRTLYRQVARFETDGMASLFPAAPPEPRHTLPAEIRQAIRELKAEYPPFRPNELATIGAARFGRRPPPSPLTPSPRYPRTTRSPRGAPSSVAAELTSRHRRLLRRPAHVYATLRR